MEENNDFEAVTLANVWIKEHILDLIRAINQNEIIAESGGLDLIALSEMETIEILRLRIDALKLMRAYIFQLKDNVSQYLDKFILLKIQLRLKGIDDHEELLKNKEDPITHSDNYYLSPDFQIKLDRLRIIKSLLIDGCGKAELLMPMKDEDLELKTSKDLEDENE